jgi:hypothetical protein
MVQMHAAKETQFYRRKLAARKIHKNLNPQRKNIRR